MRIGALLLAVVLIAGAAQAQTPSALRGPTQPDLPQGEVSAASGAPDVQGLTTPAPAGSPYALPSVLPPAAPMQSPFALQDQLQAQCASRCARDYYFCLAGETPDSCSPEWGQCRAVCSITARRSSALLR
jgi:hypothetical protein